MNIAKMPLLAPIAPTQPLGAPLQLVSWIQPTIAIPNSVTMVRLDCNQPAPAAAQAFATAAKGQKSVALMLWNAMAQQSVNNGADFFNATPWATLIAGVPDVSAHTTYFETLWTTVLPLLVAQGTAIEYVVCDIEGWPQDCPWRNDEEAGKPTVQVSASVPAAALHKATAIRRAIADPYIMTGWTEATDAAPVTNYGDINPISASFVDPNGWQYPPQPASLFGYSVSGIDAPCLYLNQTGCFYNDLNAFTHDVLWNDFTRGLNAARACNPSRLEPWIGAPSMGANAGWRNCPNAMRWIWGEQLKHLYAMGVTRALWFRAEATPASDDVFAVAALKALESIRPVSGTLPQLAYDGDSITTGGVTTRYSDFVAELAKDNVQASAKAG